MAKSSKKMAKSKGVTERISCPICDGTGISASMRRGYRSENPCPSCKGKGYTMRKK